MKFHKFIAVILCLIMLGGCAKPSTEGVVAIVYDEKIYQSSIDEEVEFSKESYENSLEYINNSGSFTEQQKEEQLEILEKPKTAEDILNDKIENIVLYHEATEKGFKLDYNTAYKQSKETYDLMMENKDENAAIINQVENYIKEHNLTTEEYLENNAKLYQRNYAINQLKEHFNSKIFDLDKGTTMEQQFYDYTNKLVEKAEVQYF